MNKRIILPIALLILVSLAFLVSAITNFEEISQTEFKVIRSLNPGWNLVMGFIPSSILSESDIKLEDIKAIFMYIPDNNKYLQIYPYSDSAMKELDAIGRAKNDEYYDDGANLYAYWVYSEKGGNLIYKLKLFSLNQPIPIELKKGWNFVGVNPQFMMKKLGDFKGNCNIERIAAWNNNQFTIIKPGDVLNDMPSFEDLILADNNQDFGAGILFKVSSSCELTPGSSSSADSGINPPTIPTDDAGSSIVPSENCQNGFDLVIDAFTRNEGSVESVSLKAFNLVNSTSSIICSYKKVGESCNYLGTEIKIISLEEDENDVITASFLVGSESFNYPQSNSFHKGCN